MKTKALIPRITTAFCRFVDTSLFNLLVTLGSRSGFQKILAGLLGGV